MNQDIEYRSFSNFELMEQQLEEQDTRLIVRGTAVVFDTPTVLYEYDGVKYYEIISRDAFKGCDMTDVIFNYNHGGKVVARLRNNTLKLITTEKGLDMEADLTGTTEGRNLYEEIKGGYVDKMSFSFSLGSSERSSEYNQETHTRTITKIKKLYDVSAVDIPAYDDTSISARNFKKLEEERRRKLLIVKSFL